MCNMYHRDRQIEELANDKLVKIGALIGFMKIILAHGVFWYVDRYLNKAKHEVERNKFSNHNYLWGRKKKIKKLGDFQRHKNNINFWNPL